MAAGTQEVAVQMDWEVDLAEECNCIERPAAKGSQRAEGRTCLIGQDAESTKKPLAAVAELRKAVPAAAGIPVHLGAVTDMRMGHPATMRVPLELVVGKGAGPVAVQWRPSGEHYSVQQSEVHRSEDSPVRVRKLAVVLFLELGAAGAQRRTQSRRFPHRSVAQPHWAVGPGAHVWVLGHTSGPTT